MKAKFGRAEKKARFAVSLVVTLSLTLLSACRLDNSGKEPIRIGAILPLSGDGAQYGTNDREGILLAVKLANMHGGVRGRQVEVSFEDSRVDAKLAVDGFERLRAQGVEVFIDDAVSTLSLALVPVLEKNHAVLVSTGASTPALSGSSPNFFRVWNSDAFEGSVAATYVRTLPSPQRIAVAHINNDYGKGLLAVFSGSLTDSTKAAIIAESFEPDARDFRPVVLRIRDAHPTLIYLIGYAAQTGRFARQLRELGITAPILGTVAMEDPEFLRLAGRASDGVAYPFPSAPSGSSTEAFREAFRNEYRKEPGLLHDVGFDAANLILKAMSDSGPSGTSVRAALHAIRDYSGASGEISFDDRGDVHKPMRMKRIMGGHFEWLPQ